MGIIYSLLDDAKNAFAEQYLPKREVEKLHGHAVVEAVFELTGKNAGIIAGLKVNEGTLYKKICPSSKSEVCYRVLREGTVVEAQLIAGSLRRMKDDVENVKYGNDCGLGLTGFDKFRRGDVIECYTKEMETSKL